VAVISNSSPLILYAKIGRLDLLREVFVEVFVPPAVHEEVVSGRAGRPGAEEIASLPWVTLRTLENPETAQTFMTRLHPGEAETIALAVELPGQTPVLLDDRAGRRVARELGLRVFGSAGVLVLAKEQGLIPTVRPVLDTLRSAGLYLSDSAYRDALMLASEEPVGPDRPSG
jgi:predicted nucleic acid-binding protein